MFAGLLSYIPVPQAVLASIAIPQQSLTCILTMSGSLSHCLSRYIGCVSGSKLDEDAVERIKVIPDKMFPLPDQQRDLSRIERPVMEIISIRNSHTPAVTTEGFDGIRTHEYGNIAANRSSGNVKFKRQIVVCIMPSMAQYLQQFLPPFTWTHALTPLRCSWGDAKKLMGQLLSHSPKFVEEILDTRIFCIALPPKI